MSSPAVAGDGRVEEAAPDAALSGDPAIITALAAGRSIADAALAGGVSERTVRRRLHDPGFVASLDAARLELLQEGLGLLSASAAIAVKVLRIVALDSASGPGPRVTAAGRLLEATLAFRRDLEFQRRLEAVERALELRP